MLVNLFIALDSDRTGITILGVFKNREDALKLESEYEGFALHEEVYDLDEDCAKVDVIVLFEDMDNDIKSVEVYKHGSSDSELDVEIKKLKDKVFEEYFDEVLDDDDAYDEGFSSYDSECDSYEEPAHKKAKTEEGSDEDDESEDEDAKNLAEKIYRRENKIIHKSLIRAHWEQEKITVIIDTCDIN